MLYPWLIHYSFYAILTSKQEAAEKELALLSAGSEEQGKVLASMRAAHTAELDREREAGASTLKTVVAEIQTQHNAALEEGRQLARAMLTKALAEEQEKSFQLMKAQQRRLSDILRQDVESLRGNIVAMVQNVQEEAKLQVQKALEKERESFDQRIIALMKTQDERYEAEKKARDAATAAAIQAALVDERDKWAEALRSDRMSLSAAIEASKHDSEAAAARTVAAVAEAVATERATSERASEETLARAKAQLDEGVAGLRSSIQDAVLSGAAAVETTLKQQLTEERKQAQDDRERAVVALAQAEQQHGAALLAAARTQQEQLEEAVAAAESRAREYFEVGDAYM